MRASQAFQESPTEMEALWSNTSGLIYSLEDRQKQLGLGDKVRGHLTGEAVFCSSNCEDLIDFSLFK